MKPKVTMLMLTSLDGRLHPSRFTTSPDGTRKIWSDMYEDFHASLDADAWIVGRVTMAEMSKGEPHPPAVAGDVERPIHAAKRSGKFAVGLDPSARLHFARNTINGDHAIALLGQGVADTHLAELAADGVSYIVSDGTRIDLPAMLEALNREFGIAHLLLEGGAGINGSFLAEGLVDEIYIFLAPAIDGDPDVQSIVAFPGGLAGKCQLSLNSIDKLDHGIARLHYLVSPAS